MRQREFEYASSGWRGGAVKIMEMTDRERFRAVMHFRNFDRLPFTEWFGFDDETLIRWSGEGMPRQGLVFQLDTYGGRRGSSIGFNPNFFGFDLISCNFVEILLIDQGPIPRFVSKTLSETEKHRIFIGSDGVIKKISIDQPIYNMPQYLDWPVKTQEDWLKLKPRFNPADPRRYPINWGEELIEYYKTTDHPIGLHLLGFFYFCRQLMGTLQLLNAFYKSPELVRDIMDFHADFLIETHREAVETLKSDGIDYVAIWEDFAYRHGPHISPKVFREFMLPNYRKVTNFLKSNGIDVILVDSDGNVCALIPTLLEAGVNGLYPLEVAAGMDAVSLRNEYEKLLLIGNIDKRALIKGKAAIEKEVESKLPYLKSKGGYIPSVDHNVSPDIPYQNYLYYVNYLRKFL
jgi:uroporphyrinogen decarboxylase